ncbi:hypothetical protein ABPG74_014775 [Tetrahymena malaccensis]
MAFIQYLNIFISIRYDAVSYLGGEGGFSLKNISVGIQQAVTVIAQNNIKLYISYGVFSEYYELTINEENKNPIPTPITPTKHKMEVAIYLFSIQKKLQINIIISSIQFTQNGLNQTAAIQVGAF